MSLAIGVFATSCQKEYKEIGEIPSKTDGITASWILSSCSSIDKAAIVEETMDITSFFYTDTKLPNINLKMESNLGTYTCDTANVAYQFFGGTSGTWSFDNPDFPKKVFLTPAGTSTVLEFTLAATIRPTDPYLKLDKSVVCGGKEVSVYRLTFTRN